ncbi:hypothetical protein KIPB_004672 [Kipferlia bialata]|uniref:AB hydrolase-1 domain-containing protein n=1 Tax=Kipferlia bialata TaxID=797122 RepID=A0A9K3CWC4_9EUKA|nr:hypothetical protein KIPB_004672 [Kipferlia bialata]|eukprot:g4672.t1
MAPNEQLLIQRFNLTGHTRPISRVLFNKDGDLIFTTSLDSSVRVWRGDSGEPVCSVTIDSAVSDLAVTADSKYFILSTSDHQVVIYELATGRRVRILEHSDYMIKGLSLGMGDEYVATYSTKVMGTGPSVTIWKLAPNPADTPTEPFAQWDLPKSDMATSIAFGPMNKTPALSALVHSMPILKKPFISAWWLGSVHIHSMFAMGFRKRPRMTYVREEITLRDGGVIGLDWVDRTAHPQRSRKASKADAAEVTSSVSDADTPSLPVVMVLHGLGGSSRERAVACVAKALSNSTPYRIVCVNMRGSGRVALQTPKSYSALSYEDVEDVVCHLTSAHGCQRGEMAAVGFSLGSMMLASYMSHCPDSPLAGCALFSHPLDSHRASHKLKVFPGHMLYTKRLLSIMKALVLRNRDMIASGGTDCDALEKVETIHEFDTVYTAPVYGFDSAEDYYTAITMKTLLPTIKTPFIAMTSRDDPFTEAAAIDDCGIDTSGVGVLVSTRIGGHMGWLRGSGKTSLMDDVAVQFTKAVLK